MPRTRKQASKNPEERAKDSGLNVISFNKSYKNALRTYEADVKISMLMVQSILKTSRNLISAEIGNRLYEDVVKECLGSKECVKASITSTCEMDFDSAEAHSSTLQASSDVHGNATPMLQPSNTVADSTSKHVGFAEIPPPTFSEKWKTPAVNHMDPGCSMVTPKVRPEDCVSVLRFPAQGEMAISMKGSPLLVSSHVLQNTVNVQVPLSDGRVLAIQPGAKFSPYEVPLIDGATRCDLLKISEHINSFVAMTDKAKRLKKN